jgi:hypothetical protein
MIWPRWQSEIIVLRLPFLVIGGGFDEAIPSFADSSPEHSWRQIEGVGTCIRVAQAPSMDEWRVSLFLASEPLPSNFFADPPVASGANTLDLTETDGVLSIAGLDKDLGARIYLNFLERQVKFEWEARARNAEIDVISVTFREAWGRRQPQGLAFR